MKPKSTTLLALLFGVLVWAAVGCGSPYYVEGQDELGDLPDSLRIQIDAEKAAVKARDESRETAQGVEVRNLGEGSTQLPLEYSPEGPYLLRRADKVEVSVLFYPELRTASTVRPDGMITAPGVGDVLALGRRPEEVAADIEAYYSRILRDPTTTVNVISFGERRAYVFGWVNKPGPVNLEQRMTVTQALSSVGSTHPDAKLATVVLIRRTSERAAQAFRLDLRGVVSGESLAADFILQPDDVVFVPRTFVSSMEQFIDQVFGGLQPIPDLVIRTYDAIHVNERASVRTR